MTAKLISIMTGAVGRLSTSFRQHSEDIAVSGSQATLGTALISTEILT
jgi:hypothetical protein